MSTIFISHSSQDNEIAREIERQLASQGHHSVFLDIDPAKGIVGGQSWERTLYRKLRACRAVIALCTNHYLDSHWCFAEMALARMEGKHIIALQADPLDEQTKMPAILTERQFIDLRRDGAEGYQRLWHALKALDLPDVPEVWNPKKPPYLGLSAYQEEHAAVFFGREEESRAGIELLERGAPGLILVLGASGSGKSSLVRAGMLPRLRLRKEDWLIVDPFRPGRDPLDELTESLVQSFRRYAPGHKGEAVSRERIRERLHTGLHAPSFIAPLTADEPDGPEQMAGVTKDERLRRLIDLLERLRQDPPPVLAGRLRDCLEWSLDDLHRICSGPAAAVDLPEMVLPYTTPLMDIANDLRRVSQRREARVLLIIDQFEELLGRKDSDEEGGRFLALLRASIEADHSPCMVLGTMRSDFLGMFQRNVALRGIDFESLSLGPMKIEGMRRVIEEPARLATIELETGLADRLLEDTETPDALPLLSFTLWLLWRDYRRDGKLENDAYKQLGGLHGAVTREADVLLASARREGKEEKLRQAFVRMVRLTEEGKFAREPVDWDAEELRFVRPIIERFVNRHLLVTRGEEGGTRTVEVAHEALFRNWKPLKAWLDNARSELLLKQQLERDAKTWQENNRAAIILWRGGRLLQARDLMGKQKLRGAAGKNSLVAEFVRSGLRRRLRMWATVTATTAAVIAVLAGFLAYALVQTDLARNQKARALDLARVSIAGEWLDQDPTKAALVLLEVEDPENTRFAPRRLSEALSRGVVSAEYRHAGPVHSVAVSADGSRVLTTSANLALVWETHTGRLLRRLQHEATVIDGSFDPTGRFIVTRSGKVGEIYTDDRAGSTAWVWDVETGSQRFTVNHIGVHKISAFSPNGQRLVATSTDNTAQLWDVAAGKPYDILKHDDPVEIASFSPDGRSLLTASGKTAQLWAVDTGQKGFTLGRDGRVIGASFSADGNLVVTGRSGSAQIWDTNTGKKLHSLSHQSVHKVSFSVDGQYLLTLAGGTVRVWNVKTGLAVRHRNPIVQNNLMSASFSEDGTLVITASGHADRRGYGVAHSDSAVRFWDAATGEKRFLKNLETNHEVMTVAFGPGHKFAVTNSAKRVSGGRGQTLREDATVRLWNLEFRDRRLLYTLDHDRDGLLSSFSPGGGQLLTASGKTARLWNVETGRALLRNPLVMEQDIHSVAFSPPDGNLVLTASRDAAQLWDVTTGRAHFAEPLSFPERLGLGSSSVSFSATGEHLITRYANDTVQVWNILTGKKQFPEPPKFCGAPLQPAMSPDGKLLVSACGKTVHLWDVETGRERFPKPWSHASGYVRSVMFSPDGKRVVSASDDHTARIWDVEIGNELRRLQHDALGPYGVKKASFSPDGQHVITASDDRTARIWDVETGNELYKLEHPGIVEMLTFNADGRFVVTVHNGDDSISRIRVWDTGTGAMRFEISIGRMLSANWSLGPFGEYLVTWQEESARVWYLETGEELFAEPLSHQRLQKMAARRMGTADLQIASISPDGRSLLTATAKDIRIWMISGEALQAAVRTATVVCLSAGFRQRVLEESYHEARAKSEACEREHGR